MTTEATTIGQEAVLEVVALRELWHTKNHPFFIEFSTGAVGLRPLGEYMAQHYQHGLRTLPSLGVAFFKGPRGDRRFILENLVEEEGMKAGPGDDRKAVDHSETVLRFCRFAGLTDEEVFATEQLPAWRARSYLYLNTVREEQFPVIVAMMASQEGQQPGINGERTLPAFEKFHGLKRDDPAIEFFAEHFIADADHSSRALDLVARLITTPELKKRALEVVDVAVKTRWACMTDCYRTFVQGQRDPLPPGVSR